MLAQCLKCSFFFPQCHYKVNVGAYNCQVSMVHISGEGARSLVWAINVKNKGENMYTAVLISASTSRSTIGWISDI